MSSSENRPRIVIFGAGNIGRSFIAPVFTAGGYEAVFVDVAPPVLEALSRHSSYTLKEVSASGDTEKTIGPVRGVDARDAEAVAAALDAASICATCVGAGNLPMVLRTIAAAAMDRTETLDIILSENLKGAGDLARNTFIKRGISLPEIDRRLGVIETSIGKMVPIMDAGEAARDPLFCRAEPFNTLIVDADGFTGPIPEVPDLLAVSPIAPWVARKLYIHNFGHAAVAYMGHRAHPEATFIWEVLEDDTVYRKVESSMKTSAAALRAEYPGVFTEADTDEHIADLLGRFRNRSLGDTIYRVGRDLKRKLHRNDRVVGPAALALRHQLPNDGILDVFAAALGFSPDGQDGSPDDADRQVRELAADPVPFLSQVVGLDTGTEPELAGQLKDRIAGWPGCRNSTPSST